MTNDNNNTTISITMTMKLACMMSLLSLLKSNFGAQNILIDNDIRGLTYINVFLIIIFNSASIK